MAESERPVREGEARRRDRFRAFISRHIALYTSAAFVKWLILGTAAGFIVGGVGVGFSLLLSLAEEAYHSVSWLIFLLPVCGVVIAAMYRYIGREPDRGADFAIAAVRANRDMPFRMVPLIFIASALTQLFGGSAGREGAALEIGGGVAMLAGRKIKLDSKDARVLTMCGMAAAFAALFGTPVACAVFSMEVISVGVMYYAAIVPCLVAALISTWLGNLCHLHRPFFVAGGVPELSPVPVLKAILIGVLCALISMLFCFVVQKTAALFRKYLKNNMLRALVGGLLVMGLTLLVRTRDYSGSGMNLIEDAFTGVSRPEAFLLKMIFTALTIGSGFKGGEIIPTLCVGATFGNVFGGLIGLDPSFGAAMGMTAVFCGVTNCPLTSILLGVEMVGVQSLPYTAIACAVSYMLSGYYGLYGEQKIVYSKLRPEFVDKMIEKIK